MKRVYLAKSNRANPNLVSAVRQTLSKFDIELVEYIGGSYSNDLLLSCDELYIIPDLSKSFDDDYEGTWSVPLGKGLYEQITSFQNDVFIVTDYDGHIGIGGIHYDDIQDMVIEIADESDYVDYAMFTVDTEFCDKTSWELYDYISESNVLKDKTWINGVMSEINDDYKTWKGNDTIQNWERKANNKKFMVLLAKK